MSITAKINMKKFQEIDLPLFTKGVEDIIGKKLEWNVDVPSFDHSYGQATFFEVEGVNESFEQYTFGPLRMVLSEFCANPDVKDMIMGVLKGINLSAQHPDGVMYGDVSFEDGYLTILSPAAHNYGPIEDVITNMMKDAIDNSL